MEISFVPGLIKVSRGRQEVKFSKYSVQYDLTWGSYDSEGSPGTEARTDRCVELGMLMWQGLVPSVPCQIPKPIHE